MIILSTIDSKFVPPHAEDCVLWFDADDPSLRLTNRRETIVNLLADGSKYINDAVKVQNKQRPRLIKARSILNYKDGVFFRRRRGDVLLCEANSLLNNIWNGGAYTAIMFRMNSRGGSNDGKLLDKGNWSISLVDYSSRKAKLKFTANFGGGKIEVITDKIITRLKRYMLEVIYDSANAPFTPTILLNGVDITLITETPTSGTLLDDSSFDMGVGGKYDGANTHSLQGYILEICFFNNIPHIHTRQRIQSAYTDKWNPQN